MKYLIHTVLAITLAGCNTVGVQHRQETQFDWMPHPIVWEHNIRTCRAQPVCNAADLFQR